MKAKCHGRDAFVKERDTPYTYYVYYFAVTDDRGVWALGDVGLCDINGIKLFHNNDNNHHKLYQCFI